MSEEQDRLQARNRRTAALAFTLILPLAAGGAARAEEGAPPAGEEADQAIVEPPASNVLHLEFATLGITGALSLNYERVFQEHWTLRVGLGGGYLILPLGILFTASQGMGAQVMANYLFFDSNHHLELGAGFSVMFVFTEGVFALSVPVGGYAVEFFPALSVAYRYQRRDGGFFIRTGIMWSFGFGIPIGGSLGWAF